MNRLIRVDPVVLKFLRPTPNPARYPPLKINPVLYPLHSDHYPPSFVRESPPEKTDSLEGTVERITFQASDTGYTVARLEVDGRWKRPITVVGPMVAVRTGERVSLEGNWIVHPNYGRQFQVTTCKLVYPSTIDGLRRYLGSGLIRGIGPVTARKIVDYFGAETLEVLESDSSRLREVPGVGSKKRAQIIEGWKEQRDIKDVMLFLQSHEVTVGIAARIYQEYGSDTIRRIQEDPYALEEEVWGIGFKTADKIAGQLGVEKDSPRRIQAGIRYVLRTASEKGHVFLPEEELITQAQAELEVREEQVEEGLETLKGEQKTIVEGERIYLPVLHQAEVETVQGCLRVLDSIEPWGARFEIPESDNDLLSQEQNDALKTVLKEPLVVLTGGPGTGKTTLLKAVVESVEACGGGVLLAAPTGRAARRLGEVTGREARTLHRTLEFDPIDQTFKRNQGYPLATDMLIVDEASMLDTYLMSQIMNALGEGTSLLLSGDVDQLPSIGPGAILKDLIDSEVVPIVRLQQVFRQARESHIITNAYRINQGQWPIIEQSKETDFFFIEEDDPGRVADLIEDLCVNRLPPYANLNPVEDIQVLCPMYRGQAGANVLNERLQERFNSHPVRVQRGGREYRIGDKVMQIRNNYDKVVFNGEVGRIIDIDVKNGWMGVQFEGVVTYKLNELDELVPAYAISVHRSQGSQYPAVVMPLMTEHYPMLYRNLLYTAITRAERLVVLVGSPKALAIALQNVEERQRHTSLGQRLQQSPFVKD